MHPHAGTRLLQRPCPPQGLYPIPVVDTAKYLHEFRALRQRLFASQYSASSWGARTLGAPPFHSACCSPSGCYRFWRGTLETETMVINFIEQLVAAPWNRLRRRSAEHGKKLISGSRRGRWHVDLSDARRVMHRGGSRVSLLRSSRRCCAVSKEITEVLISGRGSECCLESACAK